MKKTIAIGLMSVIGVLGFQEAARADWGFSWGFGGNGGYFSSGYHCSDRRVRHRRNRRHRVHRARHQKIWVEPVYRQVIVGYTECGQPIYNRVCVREGYYRRVVVGY
jgi:hypothetical protein